MGLENMFTASIREQEILRLENSRRFYGDLRHRSDERRRYKAGIRSSNVRGDNLPNLAFDLKDQDGNHYEGYAKPLNRKPGYASTVNVNIQDRMSNTPFRPDEDGSQLARGPRRQRSRPFIGEFYHWFAGIATDRQILEVVELIDKHKGQLETTAKFVETNAKSIQSLSKTTADEFQSLADVITSTQKALRQSSEVMAENMDVLSNSLQDVDHSAELAQAILQTLIAS